MGYVTLFAYHTLFRHHTLFGGGGSEAAQKRLGRRLEEVAEAVGGGYCRLQMPLKLALGVREAGRGGGVPPPLPMHPWGGGG